MYKMSDRYTKIITLLNLPNSFDKLITKYDYYIDNESFVVILDGHKDDILNIKELSRNRIITTSEDKTFKIWDLKTNCCICTVENKFLETYEMIGKYSQRYTQEMEYIGSINKIAILSDDRIIAYSVDLDGQECILGIWSEINGKYEHKHISHTYLSNITILPGELFVTESYHYGLSIWCPDNGQRTKLKDNVKEIEVVVVVSFNKEYRIISGSDKGELRVWNPTTLETECILNSGITGEVRFIIPFSQNRIVVLIAESLLIWNWRTETLLFELKYNEKCDECKGIKECQSCEELEQRDNIIHDMIIFKDINNKEWIVTGSYEGVFEMWDPDNGKLLFSLPFNHCINKISVLPNNHIILAMDCKYIALINMEKGNISYIHNHDRNIDSLLVCKNGKIITGSRGGVLQFIG